MQEQYRMENGKCVQCGLPRKGRWWTPLRSVCSCWKSMRLSELEDSRDLSDDDYLLMTDTSEKKSVKVKLGALKEYIRRN